MEPEIEKLLADLSDYQQQVLAEQKALETTEFTAVAGDGDVVVRLRGTGRLTEVRIDPPALRRYDADELGALIVEAVNAGTARVLETGRQRFAPMSDSQA
jgi:DNA-binding protein YbaB